MTGNGWGDLLVSFVGGGGGFVTGVGALNLWRQRKADRTTAAENRLQVDRDNLDKRIADNIATLEGKVIAVGKEADAAKREIDGLWSVIYAYRRRDLAWLAERETLARELILAGKPVPALDLELTRPVPVPNSTTPADGGAAA